MIVIRQDIRLSLAIHSLALGWVMLFFFGQMGGAWKIISALLFPLALIFLMLAFLLKRNSIHLDGQGSMVFLVIGVVAIFFATALRGILAGNVSIETLISNPHVGLLVWTLPLAVLLSRDRRIIDRLYTAIIVHGYIGAALLAVVIIQANFYDTYSNLTPFSVGSLLMYGVPLVCLAGKLSDLNRRLLLICWLIFIVSSVLLSNRFDTVMGLAFLSLMLFLPNKKWTTGSLLRYITLRMVIALSVAAPIASIILIYNEAWLIDTRTFLFDEMVGDMSMTELLIGRGGSGTYYSNYFDDLDRLGIEGGDYMIRQVNEIGLLHIVLKAGILGALFYVALLLVAIKKSFSFSDSTLRLPFVLYLLFHVLGLMVSDRPTFSMKFFLIWIIIGLVFWDRSAIRSQGRVCRATYM